MLEDNNLINISETELKNLAINCYSCIKDNGKKINYMTFISKMKNNECNDAIIRIFKKINIEKIKDFIDNIECISISRKNFYKKILNLRYNIIKDTYKKLNK